MPEGRDHSADILPRETAAARRLILIPELMVVTHDLAGSHFDHRIDLFARTRTCHVPWMSGRDWIGRDLFSQRAVELFHTRRARWNHSLAWPGVDLSGVSYPDTHATQKPHMSFLST